MITTKRIARGLVVTLLAPLLFLAGAPGSVDQAAVPAVTTTTPTPALIAGDVAISGGVIRFTQDGPRWHINSSHTTAGFDTTVEPTINASGDLEIEMLESRAVVSVTIEEDEELSTRGVWAGGTGGVGDLRIRFRDVDGGGIPLELDEEDDYDRLEGDFTNVWITVLSVASAAPAG